MSPWGCSLTTARGSGSEGRRGRRDSVAPVPPSWAAKGPRGGLALRSHQGGETRRGDPGPGRLRAEPTCGKMRLQAGRPAALQALPLRARGPGWRQGPWTWGAMCLRSRRCYVNRTKELLLHLWPQGAQARAHRHLPGAQAGARQAEGPADDPVPGAADACRGGAGLSLPTRSLPAAPAYWPAPPSLAQGSSLHFYASLPPRSPPRPALHPFLHSGLKHPR